MIITPLLKPSGYILTTALVESLYHILPEECHSAPIASKDHLKGMVSAASHLLKTLSKSVTTASKVYQYLRDLLPSDDGFEPLLQFSASPPKQNIATNGNNPLDCSADLDILSEAFCRAIVDRRGQDNESEPTHKKSNNQNFLPLTIGFPESFGTDCLPGMDDLQRQFLMEMDLEDMAFKKPLPMHCSPTPFGGDLL